MIEPKRGPEFKKPKEFTIEWENEHRNHLPLVFQHTILQNGHGVIFEEHRCYLCRSVVRKKIGKAKSKPEKIPKPEPQKNVPTFLEFSERSGYSYDSEETMF